MKKALVSILLIVLVCAVCRPPNSEDARATGPTTVASVSTTAGTESSVFPTEPIILEEPTVPPTQAETVPEYMSATEPTQDNTAAEGTPLETTPMPTAPLPTEPLTEPTSPPDTHPAETAPHETQSPETKPTETEPPTTEPADTTPVETEPPATAPAQTDATEPTGCRHEWICIHHDEEGHWIAGIVCDCGWTVYGDPSVLAPLWNAHSASFPPAESLFDHGGFGSMDEWIVDNPAYDEWVCRHCGEPKE